MGGATPAAEPLAPLEARVAAALEAQESSASPEELAGAFTALLQPGEPRDDLMMVLASLALEAAPVDPAHSNRLLAAADAVGGPPGAGAAALLAYARARLHVAGGDLSAARRQLDEAAAKWEQAGDVAGVLRSLLGKTQVLAMLGAYDEAEGAATDAVDRLTNLIAATGEEPELVIHLAGALHNRATLSVMQERHGAALADYEQAAARLQPLTERGDDIGDEARSDLAHNALNRATAQTFLDDPKAAEISLRSAVDAFSAAGDLVQRGRAWTNLGRLHARVGAFAEALDDFGRAAEDLFGRRASGPVTTLAAVDDDLLLRRADELPLEQATLWLALNLLPEAEADLRVAERLFRSAEQPYELAQSLYLLGLVLLRRRLPADALPPLLEARSLFDQLENPLWSNRTQVALAALRVYEAEADPAAAHALRGEALALLDSLLSGGDLAATAAEERLTWDAPGRAEALLLRSRVRADIGDLAGAATDARAAGEVAPGLPLVSLRVDTLLGRVARLSGEIESARDLLLRAMEALEGRRAALPLEEIRTAWLSDKTELYTELLLALLDAPEPSPDEIEAAFAAVERARSRALLERLMSDAGSAAQEGAAGADNSVLLEELRRRLHWLYNQLLGDGGGRGGDPALTQSLVEAEAEWQSLAWAQPQGAAPVPMTDSMSLGRFQASLAPDQQAIVYATVGDELLAFVVERYRVQLKRHLCSVAELERACSELRFELGRATLGSDYLARHGRRLVESLQAALGELYRLAVAPLALDLLQERLLILPAGALHGVPLHALWDGNGYWVERCEIAVAPSATLAATFGGASNGHEEALPAWADADWSGLAITDDAIPAARREVEAAATLFRSSTLYLDARADLQGLRAAAQADVLHIATHGLFRSDNPFFSVLKLADGWADVRTLYGLPLAARLVVLSACESGAGVVAAGEEVIGLARGFLGAGARSLVVSMWHVHDESAARMMQEFYGALTRPAPEPVRPAAALRAAQRTAIARGDHPWYWAPFYVIGA